MKLWFKRLLAGMGIGVGAAIPGVSGAAVAVIFKVYEDIIWGVNNFLKNFARALAILIPVLLGIVLAVIPCIYLFDKALDSFVFGIISIFAGFLIGSFPGVTDEVKGVKPNRVNIISIVIGAIFVILLGVASVFMGRNINIDSIFTEMPFWMYLLLIPVGVIAAVALTVPGLSGSLILLVIGFYKPLLSHTVDWAKEAILSGDFSNFGKLIGMLSCFAVGVLIGVILVSKIMKTLLAKHHDATYFAIIGFVIGSIIVLYFNYNIYDYYLAWAGSSEVSVHPALPIFVEIPVGFVLMIIATSISYFLVKKSRKAN